MTDTTSSKLPAKQLAIGPVAANTAAGNMPALNTALNSALDAGLSIAELKEILVQLYAFAGFPRALNALSEMMKVLDERRSRGCKDEPGREVDTMDTGTVPLELGTANQTKLCGGPFQDPLLEFAPAIDRFLKAHLFGDVFGRDNIDWRSRELATVAALSAMALVQSQLSAHIRISRNVGLTMDQLRQFAMELSARGEPEASGRLLAALHKDDGGGGGVMAGCT